MARYISYRETTYLQDAENANIPYDLYRQIRKLKRALEITKEHESYFAKLALLTRYEIELERINNGSKV